MLKNTLDIILLSLNLVTVFIHSAPLQPIMASQQPAYQGMMGVQQPQSASIINSQRPGMSGQIQGMVVQYTPMPSYQVVLVCAMCKWECLLTGI